LLQLFLEFVHGIGSGFVTATLDKMQCDSRALDGALFRSCARTT
jgi:hypothetical protein